MSSPELSVVCKSCGSEVSPYVTECPYCGTRLRKRAPKLERGEEGLTLKEPRRKKARRRIPRPSVPGMELDASRPYATWLLVLAPAVLLLVTRVLDYPLTDYGAIVQAAPDGPLGQTWWHYLTAPFVYDDIGYLFVICVAVALFGSELESRLGTIATFILAIGAGALSMLGAEGIESVTAGDSFVVILAGGNGMALGLIAAYAAIRSREGEEFDYVPVVIAAAVVFALPLVENSADVFAAIIGALVGGAAGFLASLGAARRA